MASEAAIVATSSACHAQCRFRHHLFRLLLLLTLLAAEHFVASFPCADRKDRMCESAAQTKRHLPASVGLLAAGTLFLLQACAGGGAADSAANADSAATASSEATHTHDGSGEHSHEETGAHTHTTADTLAARVRLPSDGEHGWTGSATLLSVGDSIRVLVSVEGSDAGARHRVELLAGSCEEPGSELATLTPVAAGSSGAGSSQTTLPGSRMDGHAHGALRVTAADGSPAACAPVHLEADHNHE